LGEPMALFGFLLAIRSRTSSMIAILRELRGA
jgi:hypothetical protein